MAASPMSPEDVARRQELFDATMELLTGTTSKGRSWLNGMPGAMLKKLLNAWNPCEWLIEYIERTPYQSSKSQINKAKNRSG